MSQRKQKGQRYQFRGESDPHEVRAIEGTQDDVDAGRVGAVGDFVVTREGHAAQWWERDTFLHQYARARRPRSADEDEQLLELEEEPDLEKSAVNGATDDQDNEPGNGE